MTAHTRDWDAFITVKDTGYAHMDLAVDGITCAACMYEIERALQRLDGIEKARVNLSSHRLSIEWSSEAHDPAQVVDELEALGYKAYPFDPARVKERGDKVGSTLLKALAVSGFAAMNIMLLSISVWSGNSSDIDMETRAFFHWVSAAIAMPTVVYAGRPFFTSAVKAIKVGRLNMDVPISIGVLLATGLSLVQTIQHAKHAYFDSAVMLLFFLLAGRYLDHMMRRKTRRFAENIAVLKAESASRLNDDGSTTELPLSKIGAGDRVMIRPGERISVDGIVQSGESELDQSLVTGETMLEPVKAGDAVFAGTMNTHGTLIVSVTAAAKGTVLDEVNRLLETALEGRSTYVQIADRASRLYAPVVHAAALLTFLGWIVLGLNWQPSLVIAISVLIITCPCALALAIPAVQVVASGQFFKERILLNAGDAIERLAAADTVIFDKTGTLTMPDQTLLISADKEDEALQRAGQLALSSTHPLSIAVAKASGALMPVTGAKEIAGKGVEAKEGDQWRRLGSPAFCGVPEETLAEAMKQFPSASFIAYAEGESEPRLFPIGQSLRDDAEDVIRLLKKKGYQLEILSGDRQSAVKDVADQLGIAAWKGELKPQDKIARVEELKQAGRNVLMVGDGLNDAPALAAANVSLSPVSAVHISQSASDAVFMGDSIRPIYDGLQIARRAHVLMQQNLWISAIYNVLAVPIAVMGFVTPLVAALAMSGSSILVTLNAVRLRLSFLSKSQ
ncbi:copper-translocating P-type ATPase [Rhodobacteraceae bacterium RKSG542]|uniref:cation-translocating P-type ATPase n=1 Tax=Pseudovibrio flavus TaxID=2529854 RepID=UPI0012BBB879|nr:cation-translocating P-type ATPase [Pseudovibrio flavus]MTI18840.1 copper-translocating P-type ATPase [Pseudovibrio flavus]